MEDDATASRPQQRRRFNSGERQPHITGANPRVRGDGPKRRRRNATSVAYMLHMMQECVQ